MAQVFCLVFCYILGYKQTFFKSYWKNYNEVIFNVFTTIYLFLKYK